MILPLNLHMISWNYFGKRCSMEIEIEYLWRSKWTYTSRLPKTWYTKYYCFCMNGTLGTGKIVTFRKNVQSVPSLFQDKIIWKTFHLPILKTFFFLHCSLNLRLMKNMNKMMDKTEFIYIIILHITNFSGLVILILKSIFVGP